jgi:hypothetical protein
MANSAGFGHKVTATVVRKADRVDDPKFWGVFKVQCYSPSGELRWQQDAHNAVVNQGLNSILNVYFHTTAKLTNFYLGLANTGLSAGAAASDTLASHAGWTELTATYSEGTRPQWSPGAASGQAVVNSTPVDFTIVGSATVGGIFVVGGTAGGENTKGGTTGTLWATAPFSPEQSVNNGDILRVVYQVNAAP